MKRKVLLIALTIFLILSMCACSIAPNSIAGLLFNTPAETAAPTEPAASQEEQFFVGMEYLGMSDSSYCKFFYYRDTVTDVVYLWGRAVKAGYAGMGGLTIMMDPETGLPLTFARWEEMYHEIISPNQ